VNGVAKLLCSSVALWLALIGPAVSAQLANSYLCIADKATGFSYNQATHQWDYARFDVAGKKHLLRREGLIWKWADFGDPSPSLEQCDNPNAAGFIFCRGVRDIRLNLNSLRYQDIYPFGYVGGLIPSPINQNRCAQSRNPIDIMVQG
jgi:hypothetical protein